MGYGPTTAHTAGRCGDTLGRSARSPLGSVGKQPIARSPAPGHDGRMRRDFPLGGRLKTVSRLVILSGAKNPIGSTRCLEWCEYPAGCVAALLLDAWVVGPALVAEPSRGERDSRNGLPASGGPTDRRPAFVAANLPNGLALIHRLKMTNRDNFFRGPLVRLVVQRRRPAWRRRHRVVSGETRSQVERP